MAEEMDVDITFSDVMDMDISMADADISRLLNGTQVLQKSHVQVDEDVGIAVHLMPTVDVNQINSPHTMSLLKQPFNSTFNIGVGDDALVAEHLDASVINGTSTGMQLNATFGLDEVDKVDNLTPCKVDSNGNGNMNLNATFEVPNANSTSTPNENGNVTHVANLSSTVNIVNVSKASAASEYSSAEVTVLETTAHNQTFDMNLVQDGEKKAAITPKRVENGDTKNKIEDTVECIVKHDEKTCVLLNITRDIETDVQKTEEKLVELAERSEDEFFEDALPPEEEIRQVLDGRRVSLSRHTQEITLDDQAPDILEEDKVSELASLPEQVEAEHSSGQSSGNYHDVQDEAPAAVAQEVKTNGNVSSVDLQSFFTSLLHTKARHSKALVVELDAVESEPLVAISSSIPVGSSKVLAENELHCQISCNTEDLASSEESPVVANQIMEENIQNDEVKTVEEASNSSIIAESSKVQAENELHNQTSHNTEVLPTSQQNPVVTKQLIEGNTPNDEVKTVQEASNNLIVSVDETLNNLIVETDEATINSSIVQPVDKIEPSLPSAVINAVVSTEESKPVEEIEEVSPSSISWPQTPKLQQQVMEKVPSPVQHPMSLGPGTSLLKATLNSCHEEANMNINSNINKMDESVQLMLDQTIAPPAVNDVNAFVTATSKEAKSTRTLLDCSLECDMQQFAQQEKQQLINRKNQEKVPIVKESLLDETLESKENKENIQNALSGAQPQEKRPEKPRASLLLQFDPLANLKSPIKSSTPTQLPPLRQSPRAQGTLIDIDQNADLHAEHQKIMDTVNEEKMNLLQEVNRLKLELIQIKQENTTLTLEIQKKEEVYLKAEAQNQIRESQYQEEIKQLLEKLESVKEQNNNEELSDMKKELKQFEAENKKLFEEIAHYKKILNEYESTLSAKNCENEKLKTEHATVSQHLATLEMSFSDTITKYERCKEIISGFSRNEETLQERLEKSNRIAIKYEERYETLKSHANSQLDRANKDLLAAKEAHKAELAKLNTINKRLDIKNASLQQTLEQKIAECTALASLCDEMTGS